MILERLAPFADNNVGLPSQYVRAFFFPEFRPLQLVVVLISVQVVVVFLVHNFY